MADSSVLLIDLQWLISASRWWISIRNAKDSLGATRLSEGDTPSEEIRPGKGTTSVLSLPRAKPKGAALNLPASGFSR
jgi:hypothetical protein